MEKIFEQAMLYDFYGELLNDHQKSIYEEYVLDNLSLSEIAESRGISRQGVYDNLSRTEALLQRMEEKTGCVRRDLQCRMAAKKIADAAKKLSSMDDPTVADLGNQILSAVEGLEE